MPSLSVDATEEDFQQTAKSIKAQYFHQWDHTDEWRFESVEDLDGASGKAFYKEKVVRIVDSHKGPALPLVLIHEICHAVCCRRDRGHGKHWQNQMLRAAKDAANKFGAVALAEAITQEVDGYARQQGRIQNRFVYDEIGDVVLDLLEESSSLEELLGHYESVKEFVRRNHGMTAQEFSQSFPRERQVFEKSCRESWKIHLRQKQFKKLRQKTDDGQRT